MSFVYAAKAKYNVMTLSEKTMQWLSRMFDDRDLDEYYIAKRSLSPIVDHELEPYRSNSALKLYRGFHWPGVEDYLGASNKLTPNIPRAGMQFTYDDDHFSSWTPSPRAAWGYSTGGDGMRIVIEATIPANKQVVDTLMLPTEVLTYFHYKSGSNAESREVVVRPGKYQAKIIYVGYEDGDWHESEVPPIINP